jgi:hypothetical protein
MLLQHTGRCLLPPSTVGGSFETGAEAQWPAAQGEVVASACDGDKGVNSAVWLMESVPFVGREASVVAALDGDLMSQHFTNLE